MKFTGERFLSELEIPEISYEHWNRYLFARQFVKDKIVLDIACGEGYGSFLLSNIAGQVIGIDIDQETINFANNKYVRNNLKFKVGSATHLSLLQNNFFDVIVSYETIEHIAEDDQNLFLQEVKRTLKHDGIFIVSTPNKKLYSDTRCYDNEFHIKEFYFEDFNIFLKSHFKYVDFLGQTVEMGAYIGGLDGQSRTLSEDPIILTEDGFYPTSESREVMYFIAVCSDAHFEKANASFSYDTTRKLMTNNQYVNSLRNQISRLTVELDQSKNEILSYAMSTSWLITRPLRKTSNLFRRLFYAIRKKTIP
jgi:SAM-dependent methyltransferase